jgi:uncharacterized membrane protein
MWGLVLAATSVAMLVGYATTHWVALFILVGTALFFGFAWKTK